MEMKQSQVFRWAKWGKSYKNDSSLQRCHFRGLLKYLEALRARREFGGGKGDGMWDLLMDQSLWVYLKEPSMKPGVR